jgi:hypothetical protein
MPLACTGGVFRKHASEPHMMQVLIDRTLRKWARAIGIGEGRGPDWPSETQRHVDGGVSSA